MTTNQDYAHPDYLVEPDWLADHLYDANLVVVDCDVDAGYNRGHIPGAVLIPDNYIKNPDTDRVLMMTPEQFADMCARLGIGDETSVVCYDNGRSVTAARLWWALNTYGHTDVRILNGGWRGWAAAGHAITFERPPRARGVTFAPRQDTSMLVSVDELKAACTLEDSVVWDIRSYGEWDGSNNRANTRSGHIPGAVHLEWTNLMDPETHRFKSAADMRGLLAEHGITPDKTIYTY